ncbi:MAG: tRNA (adenosine(37)-N6)-dimethylallyltransferase MiaA [Candidatus Pacebacteria bacterium]|nr:tRNA (adenosine(37)-N6)-dimethylallyltransferase MiaA [Candidatus Paceibacterota bacterium]
MNKLIVILGPTACGKTDLSIKLAKRFKGAVVSADSRQVYQGMNIGTGKITKKEMQGIPHYLLDVTSPKRRFSVAQYQKMAYRAINKIIQNKGVPFLVGGSPFYVYSIIYGWGFPALKANLPLRQRLGKKTEEQLFAILKKLDPKRAKQIDSKNKRRLVRAVEIAKSLGEVPQFKKNPQYACLLIGIKKGKEELSQLVHKRLLKRFRQGMVAEVKRLKANGLSWKKLDDFGLEYRWIARYLQNKINKQEMVAFLQKDIEHFAKRQMTWFKKDPNIHWVKNEKAAEKLIKTFL